MARWRYRTFAIGLIVVGVILAVGTYPFTDPTPFGALIKAAGPDSTAELALRSTNRIVPLVPAGPGPAAGRGNHRPHLRRRWLGWVVLALSCALIAADLPAAVGRSLVATNLERPSTIPAYVYDAAGLYERPEP